MPQACQNIDIIMNLLNTLALKTHSRLFRRNCFLLMHISTPCIFPFCSLLGRKISTKHHKNVTFWNKLLELSYQPCMSIPRWVIHTGMVLIHYWLWYNERLPLPIRGVAEKEERCRDLYVANSGMTVTLTQERCRDLYVANSGMTVTLTHWTWAVLPRRGSCWWKQQLKFDSLIQLSSFVGIKQSRFDIRLMLIWTMI